MTVPRILLTSMLALAVLLLSGFRAHADSILTQAPLPDAPSAPRPTPLNGATHPWSFF